MISSSSTTLKFKNSKLCKPIFLQKESILPYFYFKFRFLYILCFENLVLIFWKKIPSINIIDDFIGFFASDY